MKFFSFYIIIIILFSLYLCEDSNSDKNNTKDPSINFADLEEKYGKTQSTLEDSPEELQKKREQNEKKFKEQIAQCLKELGLENTKTITREQFKSLFLKLFETILKSEKDKKEKEKDNEKEKEKEKKEDEEEKKSGGDLNILNGFAVQIFENIIDKDNDAFEVDKISEYFEPKNIIKALKNIFKAFGLDSLIDSLADSLEDTFGGLSSDNKTSNETSKEIKNKTNNESNEEKSSEL